MLPKSKLKKKLKKIFIFVLAVIIAFSTFIISASALNEPLFFITIARPTVSPQNAYFEVYYDFGYGSRVETVIVSSSSSEGMYLKVSATNVYISNRVEEDGALSAFWLSTNGTGGWLNSYEGQITCGSYGTILGIKAYGFANISFEPGVGSLTTDFNVVYSEQQIAYQQIDLISKMLSMINQDRNALSDAILSQTGHLVQSQQQTTTQIIQNQQALNEELKQNQDKNTDKVLNGGHDSPQYEDYSNNATLDESAAAENQAQNMAQSGISEFNSFGSAITNMFTGNTSFYKGVRAMSGVIGQVLSKDWVSSILMISLYFGIFCFVVGAVSTLTKKSSNSKSKNKNKNP